MKKRVSMLVTLAAAAVVLAGCTGYRTPPPAFHAVLTQPYRLDSGDRVRVIVYEQPDLSNTYSVDQAGYISFPLVGAIAARGSTAKQLEKKLAEKLRQGYLREPDVSVEVDQYRPVFIMGEVGAPGQYSYVPSMTVQQAVAVAGGYTPRANQSLVDITRQIDGHVMTGRVTTSDPLMPGDTVYIRERLF
ncbi:sugar ABC transporter substrate-binding protein [Nitratireductor aestuarii]|uniref:Sugar ABC transporter substrate-binding protein n=1 Tax=Nitratireductor aestuarii TaxID=1735103 RepID=A0A916VY01_9HYPH|nr:polysaccharide biosynthesis/export family protein [Nitratireductor aestuarii]GGA51116.1 sugar ABC transporter substrate-binding protein [Nitratireductor aestuarii]